MKDNMKDNIKDIKPIYDVETYFYLLNAENILTCLNIFVHDDTSPVKEIELAKDKLHELFNSKNENAILDFKNNVANQLNLNEEVINDSYRYHINTIKKLLDNILIVDYVESEKEFLNLHIVDKYAYLLFKKIALKI